MAAQSHIGNQVTCKVDAANAFSDADYANESGVVGFLTDSPGATGPVPTVRRVPPAPATGSETHEPYGVLANRVEAFGEPTLGTGNQLTYSPAVNMIVSGIVAVNIPNTQITVDGTSIGRGLGYVTTDTPAATDGIQPVATGGKGRIVARNGRDVYWDIRAK